MPHKHPCYTHKSGVTRAMILCGPIDDFKQDCDNCDDQQDMDQPAHIGTKPLKEEANNP